MNRGQPYLFEQIVAKRTLSLLNLKRVKINETMILGYDRIYIIYWTRCTNGISTNFGEIIQQSC